MDQECLPGKVCCRCCFDVQCCFFFLVYDVISKPISNLYFVFLSLTFPFFHFYFYNHRSRWSLDGGGSGLLPQHEAMMGLGGHYLKHSLGLHNLSEATKIPVDLYPEDRLISGRLRKEDDKVDRYERAKENHHEKFGVFGSSIEMPNAIELAAPIPLEPLLGEWAHGVPKGDGGAKQRLKDLFAKEDETMQGALRYAARKDHSTLTAELSQDVRNT